MKENGQQSTYQILQPLLLSIMMAVGIFLGYKMNDKADISLVTQISEQTGNVQIGSVEEVLKLIDSRYVDSKDRDELIEVAIESVMKKLDPHSLYLPPSKLSKVNEVMDGSFLGLGIESIFTDDTVGILKVLSDSPASKAKLKPFDQIIQIDSTIVAGKKLDFDQIKRLLNPSDQDVAVKVKRVGTQGLLSFNVKLDKIPIHTASAGAMIDENTAIIKIEQFTANTYREFMESYEELFENNKLKNLIIDLRGNPGGYLPEATKILNQLTNRKDITMLFTIGKEGAKREYKTNGKAFFNAENIAVLVDEGSASGAEIIAGTLQDWDRALIIGRKTFGKGLVQEQFNLSNGGALRLTTARYFLPSGRNIQKDYTDLDQYQNELNERVRTREIFDKGNLNNTAKKNDTAKSVYKSLVYGRELSEQGGVTPDIFIPADSSEYQSVYLKYKANVMPYVYQVMRNFPSTQSINDVSGLVFKDYLVYSQKRNPSLTKATLTIGQKESILREMNQCIKYITSSEDDDIVYKSATDPFVLEAVSYFKNPNLAQIIKK